MLIQLETQCSKPKPRSVFYSYSHKDEDLRDELDAHLTLLKRDGFISTWHDRKIRPGDEWDHVINENLETADIILFLVSHHFLASQYCRDIEVKRAMERCQKHEAILIPIILKSCVWTSEAFAKLQVLPKNCRPLAEWPDSGFAQVAEELRVMMVDLLYPQRPSEATGGHHGNWILKLRSRASVDSQTRTQQIVTRLREYTEDFTITLQATATTQVLDGEKEQVGLMLILTGTPGAFAILDKAQREGHLAAAIDEDILSLYVIYGATVQGSSTVGGSQNIAEVEGKDLLLRPGKKVNPPLLVGLHVPKGETGDLEFIFDHGDTETDTSNRRRDYSRLQDYFRTALAIKNDFQWVNLSAYETDRMLPKELSGTAMGRNLLAQDCMLKRLTASFMHPDSPIGREYWQAVYAESRRLFGTSRLPFRSFQKVWVSATKADIYADDASTWGKDTVLASLAPPCGYHGALVVDSVLGVQCEEDMLAVKNNPAPPGDSGPKNRQPSPSNADFTIECFRRIILPQLQTEVNEGEHFAELRQIYSAMILATWLKKSIAVTQHAQVRLLADSGKPDSVQLVMGDIRSLGASSDAEHNTAPHGSEEAVMPHSHPDAPAFAVPENVEFFNEYVRLFKNGVFRCARSEDGDTPQERLIRVYFSGAIDFRDLLAKTQCLQDPCISRGNRQLAELGRWPTSGSTVRARARP